MMTPRLDGKGGTESQPLNEMRGSLERHLDKQTESAVTVCLAAGERLGVPVAGAPSRLPPRSTDVETKMLEDAGK